MNANNKEEVKLRNVVSSLGTYMLFNTECSQTLWMRWQTQVSRIALMISKPDKK